MNDSNPQLHPTAPANRADWTNLLRKLGVKPSRSMGQNFLVEPDVVRRIANVAGIAEGDHIVEIGPGLGILTRELLARGCRVTGVELDDQLARFLTYDLRDDDRFSLVRHDARHVDIGQLTGSRPYQVVANLPYSVATVIIRHFIESPNPPDQLTVMVQREVAERMTAPPPEMSLLGLATQFYTEAKLAFIVKPGSFAPPPKVESAVLTLRVHTEHRLDFIARDRMFSLATMAFQRRRKTITNGLSQGLDLPKDAVETALSQAEIDPMRRPQTLSVDEWMALALALPEES
jgi:16S rRNA (adenine1518-N6/adenine1519-N6)-dimethyltransferase